MGPFEPGREVRTVRTAAKPHLTAWVAALHDPCEGVPRSVLLHGYSGRWNLELHFTRWWDLPVQAPNHVTMEGFADMYIPLHGQEGSGVIVTQVDAVFLEPPSSIR